MKNTARISTYMRVTEKTKNSDAFKLRSSIFEKKTRWNSHFWNE